jgi:hypothetical protein
MAPNPLMFVHGYGDTGSSFDLWLRGLGEHRRDERSGCATQTRRSTRCTSPS